MQVMQFLQQRAGQRAQARPDLDHIVFRLGTDRADDVGDDLLIDKKILAKFFLGFMPLIFRHLGGQPDRFQQAAAVGLAGSRQIQCRTVIHRGADDGQADSGSLLEAIRLAAQIANMSAHKAKKDFK